MTQCINAVGLIFDIIGVVGLFFARDKGLEPLTTIRIRISSTRFVPTRLNEIMGKEIDELTTQINSIINRTNENNRIVYKRSRKWITLIVIGFVMQLISVLLPT